MEIRLEGITLMGGLIKALHRIRNSIFSKLCTRDDRLTPIHPLLFGPTELKGPTEVVERMLPLGGDFIPVSFLLVHTIIYGRLQNVRSQNF